MKNRLCARIFYEIADILEIQDVQWKPAAYRRAARTLESLSEDVEEIYEKGGLKALKSLPGIGMNIAKKIEEIIKTGTLGYYERLKKELPVDLETITSVPGMGPKKAKKLYDSLGIRTLEDLRKAAEEGMIRNLPGFGKKSEEEILRGIALLERTKGRALLGYVLPDIEEIISELKGCGAVNRIDVAGSVRRMKETIGDIDILITSKEPARVMDYFVSLSMVEEVIVKGMTKTSVRLTNGLNCDLRVVAEESYGSALQYFTGSKDHNIAIRKIAISKNYKLSEYGLFKKGRRIAGRTEEEVYKKLGLEYIPPELRENTGEVEAAQKGELPKLVGFREIKGDLHVHSKWSDGAHSIEEMAYEAERMGYEYILISDHAGRLFIAHGLNDARIRRQWKEIDEVQKKVSIRILKGAEIDIKKDGSLSLSNSTMKELDVGIGAIHSNFRMPEKEMTRRIVRAMENENLDIIAHPSGRLIGTRDSYQLDYDELFHAAKETGTVFEINAYPERLDLWDSLIKKAIGMGVKLSIGTDSHSTDHLRFMKLGVGMARRGWCETDDIVNTLPLKRLFKVFG